MVRTESVTASEQVTPDREQQRGRNHFGTRGGEAGEDACAAKGAAKAPAGHAGGGGRLDVVRSVVSNPRDERRAELCQVHDR